VPQVRVDTGCACASNDGDGGSGSPARCADVSPDVDHRTRLANAKHATVALRRRLSDLSPTKPRTVLFSGDDVDAKQPVNNLIEEVGFCCVDLGSLAVGGRLQQLGGPLAGVRLTFEERFVL
jgi:predicted dinucleotide-binding enzyme